MYEAGTTKSQVAVADVAEVAVTPKSMMSQGRAQRLHAVPVVAPEHVGPVNEDSLPNRQESGFIATSATFGDGDPLVDAPVVEKKVEQKAAPVEGQAAAVKKEQADLLLGKFKTDADVQRGYQELEAKFTQQAQELAALKKPAVAAVDAGYTVPEIEIDAALAEELFSNPQAAVKKIVAKAVDAALKGVSTKDAKTARNAEVKDVREWFAKDHAPLATNLKAMQAIEGLAGNAEGSTMLEKFQNAAKDYLSLVGAAAATAKADAEAAAAETTRQVESAGMPESRKGSGDGKKVWKQSDIDWLMEHDRAKYQQHALEIATARKEGRVRDDL